MLHRLIKINPGQAHFYELKTHFLQLIALFSLALGFLGCSVGGAETSAEAGSNRNPVYKDSVEVYRYQGSEAIINEKYLKESCSEPVKALIAYYCFQFNTSCSDTANCQLTQSLGLSQNSDAHKNLVLKWLKDEETKLSIANGGNVKPNGNESYSWLSNLHIYQDKEYVQVKYLSSWISNELHGKGQGTDEYKISENQIQVIKRNHTELDIQ